MSRNIVTIADAQLFQNVGTDVCPHMEAIGLPVFAGTTCEDTRNEADLVENGQTFVCFSVGNIRFYFLHSQIEIVIRFPWDLVIQ